MKSDFQAKYIGLAKEYLEEKLEKVSRKCEKEKEEKKKAKILNFFASLKKYF